ncbi:MAG TPA: subunit of meta cleavage enzyme [Herbaspirillum sp.]|uniref:subunit of meta cleavage enzyme n=1 Tax=Herbaspirillum sp. TaxID=1890675 RepID=UPI002D2E6416|nr:subunit of meta cleavage enzyme [Herbaspirillum sp.]HZG18878.1 subunit of meta cleavage enzyme [Herbaspirillum sp.]
MSGNWVEQIPSQSAYWMNKVLFEVHHNDGHLKRYLDSPDAYLSTVPMPEHLRVAVRDNDIGAMYLAGANPYLLRAHCLGLRIPEPDFVASLRAVAGGQENG